MQINAAHLPVENYYPPLILSQYLGSDRVAILIYRDSTGFTIQL